MMALPTLAKLFKKHARVEVSNDKGRSTDLIVVDWNKLQFRWWFERLNWEDDKCCIRQVAGNNHSRANSVVVLIGSIRTPVTTFTQGVTRNGGHSRR